MKSRVNLSKYSLFVTVITIAVLCVCAVLTFDTPGAFVTITVLLLIIIIAGLLYSPCRIEADGGNIIVRCPVRAHRIPISEVESVHPFQPTMGAICVLGSGGFMGYWGIFREGDIGRYKAFHGRSSDCFLVKMKHGTPYVLGCENPDTMIAGINALLLGMERKNRE